MKIKNRIQQLNSRLANILVQKGIEANGEETTTNLIKKVGLITKKEEQEKTVKVAENKIVEIVPDEGKVLSKAIVDVNVESAGGNDETIRAIIEGDIAEIILPESVKKIGGYKFYMNQDLVNIQCTGITSIGTYAFYLCKRLALTELPAGITRIENYAFNSCTKLALTELPAGITRIGQGAFSSCTSLALTELPAGITSIGQSTFSSCKSLALTELPAGITSIGEQAFYQCTGLTSITFKGKPSTIASNAFQHCNNLKTINVPWAEGEVLNAPWGAINATINYNYTGA